MNKSRLKNLAISENGFIFDPVTGYSYNCNRSAILSLNLLMKELDREAILDELMNEFEVERDTLSQDYDFFLLQLRNLGLIGSMPEESYV